MKNNRVFVSLVRCYVHGFMLILFALAVGANYSAYIAPSRFAGREDVMWLVASAFLLCEVAVSTYFFVWNHRWQKNGHRMLQNPSQTIFWIVFTAMTASICAVILRQYPGKVTLFGFVLIFVICVVATLLICIFLYEMLKAVTSSRLSNRIYHWLTDTPIVAA